MFEFCLTRSRSDSQFINHRFPLLSPISWDHLTFNNSLISGTKPKLGHQRSFQRLHNRKIKHLHFQLLTNSIVQVLACPAYFLMHARLRLLDLVSNEHLWSRSVKHFGIVNMFFQIKYIGPIGSLFFQMF